MAHIEYEKGLSFTAYGYLEMARFYYLPEEEQKEVEAFKKEVEALNTKLRREYEENERKQTEERIRTGVPFVGMPESRIGDTTIGKPSSDIGHNKEMINGKVHSANLYSWYRGGDLIFTARCIDGEVYQVWDYRDDPIKPYQPKSGSKKVYEFPDYDDYLDAEDLYAWYYDDFYDYEEAEDALDGWD